MTAYKQKTAAGKKFICTVMVSQQITIAMYTHVRRDSKTTDEDEHTDNGGDETQCKIICCKWRQRSPLS